MLMSVNPPVLPLVEIAGAGPDALIVVDVDGERVHADRWEDVWGYLIDGFADTTDEDDRLTLRAAWATLAAHAVQQQLMASVDMDVEFTDAEHGVADRSAEDPPLTGEWTGNVPLVLTVTDYAPWTAVASPVVTSAERADLLWWVDPGTDESLAWSLDRAGFMAVVRPEAAPVA